MTTTGPIVDTALHALDNLPTHLDQHGWCQGKDINGAGAECLRGALAHLCNGGPTTLTGPAYTLAYNAVTSHVGKDVTLWNDTDGRTLDEVKTAVTATADAMRADLLGPEQLAADSIVCATQAQIEQVVAAGKIVVIDKSWRGSSSAVLWGSSSAVLWDSSSAVLRDSSSAVLRDSSSAVLRGSSSAELRDSSSAVLWGSSSAVLHTIAAVGIWRRYENGLWLPHVVTGADEVAANGARLRLVGGTVQRVES